jgi:catalase
VRRVGRLVLDRVVDNFFAETEQVAFHTANVVPGIDFTNDPLLQGRNFSYLDTQLSRLGSPNFTHLPVNAPKCPFHHFQQDGHMAFVNPRGRANYEPNSWGGARGGPREDPARGYRSVPAQEAGPKLRAKAERFADHYSQARQFYLSQTETEQTHIKDAFVFELSKVETKFIRHRMVSHLLNVDEDLARKVADGLGLETLPAAAEPARPVITDLPPSPALSILANGPKSFSGRKLGILATDGADAKVLAALVSAAQKAGAMVEIVAPKVAGITASDGTVHEARQKVNGGPSVLYDAVAIVLSPTGASQLASESTARDFVSDAWAHAKFIAFVPQAKLLLDKAGVTAPDAGCFEISASRGVDDFLHACRDLRFWAREPTVHAV